MLPPQVISCGEQTHWRDDWVEGESAAGGLAGALEEGLTAEAASGLCR